MLTRREFVAQVAAAGAAVAALPSGFAACLRDPRAPVVSIHMDQPYIDVTGRAVPYRPAAGARGGAPVAHLDETELRMRFVYL